MHMHTQERK